MFELIYRKSWRFTRRRRQCANLQVMQLGASGISAAGVAAIGVGIAVTTTNHIKMAIAVAKAIATRIRISRIAIVAMGMDMGMCMRDCCCGAGIYAMRTALIVHILIAPKIVNAIHAQQCPKSILIPRPRRRQLEAEQMPLMVQLLLQVAVHRERALAAAAPAPTTTSASATTIVKVVPRMLAAARSGCVPRRGPGILFGHRRYVTRYEQYGGRSSRTCSRRRHQDALRAAA